MIHKISLVIQYHDTQDCAMEVLICTRHTQMVTAQYETSCKFFGMPVLRASNRGSSPSSTSSAVRYSPVYVKALLRKGRALMGLGCTRDAVSAFQEGLRRDPFHADLRKDLDAGHKALLEDVLTGNLSQTLYNRAELV